MGTADRHHVEHACPLIPTHALGGQARPIAGQERERDAGGSSALGVRAEGAEKALPASRPQPRHRARPIAASLQSGDQPRALGRAEPVDATTREHAAEVDPARVAERRRLAQCGPGSEPVAGRIVEELRPPAPPDADSRAARPPHPSTRDEHALELDRQANDVIDGLGIEAEHTVDPDRPAQRHAIRDRTLRRQLDRGAAQERESRHQEDRGDAPSRARSRHERRGDEQEDRQRQRDDAFEGRLERGPGQKGEGQRHRRRGHAGSVPGRPRSSARRATSEWRGRARSARTPPRCPRPVPRGR